MPPGLHNMALPNKIDPFPRLAAAVTLPERKIPSDGEGEGGGHRRRRNRE